MSNGTALVHSVFAALLLQAQGDGLQLRRQGGNGVQDIANLPVPPARGEGIDPLAGVLTRHAAELPRWLLLPASSGLRRTLLLPAAARERLREVLAFEIERQTPFAIGDVLYDGRVLGVRDDGQLQAELVVVPPTCDDFSHNSTSSDFFAANKAAAMPPHPVPNTSTSCWASQTSPAAGSPCPPDCGLECPWFFSRCIGIS